MAACAPGASTRSIQAQGWAGRPPRSRTKAPWDSNANSPQQGRQLGAPEDHVAPGQERVEGRCAQICRHGLECFDGEQGEGGVHVRGLAEEPVAHHALAGHQLDPVGIRGGHVRRAVPGAAEVGMARGHEQVQDLHVVLIGLHHAIIPFVTTVAGTP